MIERSVNLVVAVSGASGALYAASFIRALCKNVAGQSSLIVSPTAIRVHNQEMETRITSAQEYIESLEALIPSNQRKHTFTLYDHMDVGARPASGSTHTDGMVIIPCSMKTLSGIAHGYTSNLIERAAEVTLKERRRLIVVPRETPYGLIQLRNMTALTEAGGIVLPASPGFYQNPKTFDDLGDFIASRAFSLLGLPPLIRGWQE
ncbi:MAG: UbiX family flavin prenyltransferase [Leptospirales bacterium]|nr:UbiX family flavin prenyltransferase [Leptospirales bacterium]